MINTKLYRGLSYIALTFAKSLNLSMGWSQPALQSPDLKVDAPKAKSLTPSQQVGDTQSEPLKPKGPPPPPPVATLKCTPQTVLIGAPVTCVVEVIYPKTMSVQVITPPNTRREASTPPQQRGKDQLVIQRAFSVRHYDPDRPLRVKNISLTWSALGGHSGIVRLPQQKIKVSSVLTGVSQPHIRDFSHPLGHVRDEGSMSLSQPKTQPANLIQARAQFWARHAPPSLQEVNWTLVVILGLIVVSIVGILIGWVTRRIIDSMQRDEGPYVDPRPAHIIAWSELDLLAQARLIEAGAHKPYSLRISEIVRAYFGRRYQFAGLEMTSDEMRENLSEIDLDDEVLLILDHFLSDTDLIKFADLTTSASALEELAHKAHRMIDLTRERDPEEDEEETQTSHESLEQDLDREDPGSGRTTTPIQEVRQEEGDL